MTPPRNQGGYSRNTRDAHSSYRPVQRYNDRNHDEYGVSISNDQSSSINAVSNSSEHIKGSVGIEKSSNAGRNLHSLDSTESARGPPSSSSVSTQCHHNQHVSVPYCSTQQRYRTSKLDYSVPKDHSCRTRSPLQGETSFEHTVTNSSDGIKGSGGMEQPSIIGRWQKLTERTTNLKIQEHHTLSMAESPKQKKELPSSSANSKDQSSITKRYQRGQAWSGEKKELLSSSVKDQSSTTETCQRGSTQSEVSVVKESSEHPKSLPLVNTYMSRDWYTLPVHAGRQDIISKTEGPPHAPKLPESVRTSGCSPELSETPPTAKNFDICPTKRAPPVGLKPSLFEKNRERRKEISRSQNGPQRLQLRSGMVLLRNYISYQDQIKIIKVCRGLGLGDGGFYNPGFSDGGKMQLQMMCLGKNWDPETNLYENRRPIDDAVPPSIPDEFKALVSQAIQSSHAFIKEDLKKRNPEKMLPAMQPDICIVNFYTKSSKLGLHQDKDESSESLNKGLPVVSFSIGDSADFVYADDRDEEKPEKVLLESGDVLIFGGKARHIFHGVPSIRPGSAPRTLVDEADLRPGRLNLTFRQY